MKKSEEGSFNPYKQKSKPYFAKPKIQLKSLGFLFKLFNVILELAPLINDILTSHKIEEIIKNHC
jgi:hypothetical protein